MKKVFYLQGYGIPEKPAEDGNYSRYLVFVFNYIFDYCRDKRIKPEIFFSGGKTDLIKPYCRTETGEMRKIFTKLANRPSVKEKTREWQYREIKKSFSAVEGLLVLKQEISGKVDLTVFCELIRAERMRELAKKIFDSNITIAAVDFDASPGRYLDRKIIIDKEKKKLKKELKMIDDPKLLKEYHQEKVNRIEKLKKMNVKEIEKYLIKEYL